MAITTSEDLITQITGAIVSNTAEAVTAQQVRNILINLTDSSLNRLNDIALLGLKDYSTGRTYNIGEGVIYDPGDGIKIYRATATTSGPFNALSWEPLTFDAPAAGDMYKSTYDTNNSGVVDAAESLTGTPGNSAYYGTDPTGLKGFHALPTPAVTGDMLKATYDTNNSGIVDQSEALSGAPGNSMFYGTDPAGVKGFFGLLAVVRTTLLEGLSTATSAVITASDTVLGGLGKLQAQINNLISGFTPLTYGPTVTVAAGSSKTINRTLTVTSTAFNLDFTGLKDSDIIDIKCKFSGVTNTLISLIGTGITHTDSGVIISALYYSDVDGGEFRLTAKVEGTKVDWITGPGNVVQLLSASTSDIPSVNLVNSEFLLRYKSGGNAFGAAASLGLTDNFTLTLLQNNAAAAAFTSTTSLIRGLVLIGAATGTPHSNQQSAGSIARFVRSITAARTLDVTDNVILANGTFNVTLPTAVGILGRTYYVKNMGTGTITIATTSSQTIDGATTRTLSTQYTWLEVISDGTNWALMG